VTGSDALPIGHLSKRTGVVPETIRYYEHIGLLPAPPRSTGGHRVYRDVHLRRLVFIRRSRELGFSLQEIRTLLGMVDGGYTCGEVRELTLGHLDEVRQKIADLQRLEQTLEQVALHCDGGTVPECPVIDSLFERGN